MILAIAIDRPPLAFAAAATGFAQDIACRPETPSPVGNVSPRPAACAELSENPVGKALDENVRWSRLPASNVFPGAFSAWRGFPDSRITGRSRVQ